MSNTNIKYRKSTNLHTIHAVDAHVGKRMRRLRLLRNLTLSEVSEAMGISFQQLQKYETGTNRISASKLYVIASILNTKPYYFFQEMEDNKQPETLHLDKESKELATMIANIEDDELKTGLANLIKLIASKVHN